MPEMNPTVRRHDLIMESRRKLTLTGIIDVASFDDETIVAQSECGELTVRGRELKITGLSVESGDMTIEGEVNSLSYSGGADRRSFLSRMLG